MAKKKQPDKDARPDKDKPETTEDLSEMMSMDEDWEILELTERTIVRQAPEDEETISLSPPESNDNEEEEYVFVTDESTDAADAGDDVMDLSEPEADEDDLEEDIEVSQALAAAEEAEEKGADLEDIADFSELEAERPASAKTNKKKQARSKTVKGKTGREKPAMNKMVVGIIALLSLVMVALIVVIVMLLQRQPDEPVKTASVKTGQPIAKAISTPEPVTKTRPAPATEPRPAVKPKAAAKAIPTPKPRPAVPAPPVVEDRTTPPPATQVSSGSGTTGQIQPTVPVAPASEHKPIPTPQPATRPVVAEDTVTAAAPSNENMVHILQSIDFQETGGVLQMRIVANGPVGEYKSFPLSSPARLVIDLFGKWNKPPFLEKKVATGYISRIRLGQHDDKLRIVADLRTDQDLSPVFIPTRDGLTINLSVK